MFRDVKNAWLGGVCAGLARRFDIPVLLVRLAFFAAFWFLGSGVLLYILLWIFCKAEPTG